MGILDIKLPYAIKSTGFIVIFCGFFAGLIFGQQEIVKGTIHSYTDTVFIWSTAITWWISCFVSGLFLIGFGEIIEILHSINLNIQNCSNYSISSSESILENSSSHKES